MSALAQTTTRRPPQDRIAPVVSVVIPCLNEAQNIECCVTAALEQFERMGIAGEVVVADNGSEDDSAQLAKRAGARVARGRALPPHHGREGELLTAPRQLLGLVKDLPAVSHRRPPVPGAHRTRRAAS